MRRFTINQDDIVLIQNTSNKTLSVIAADLKDWFKHLFEWFHPWKPTNVSYKRMVCNRWIGVPTHALTERFFAMISFRIGTFIKVDEITASKSRVGLASVLLSLPILYEINRILKVKVDNKFLLLELRKNINGSDLVFQVLVQIVQMIQKLRIHTFLGNCTVSTYGKPQ